MSSSTETSKLATAKTILSAVGSIAAATMVARSVIPPEFQDYLTSGIHDFFKRFSNQLTIVIDEFESYEKDELYEAAQFYLGHKLKPNAKTRRLKARKPKNETIRLAMEDGEEVVEFYKGAKFTWAWVCQQKSTNGNHNYDYYFHRPSARSHEVRYFQVTFHKKHKQLAIETYLPFVIKEAKAKVHENKSLKIFTLNPNEIYPNSTEMWQSVSLDHPATFDTLAMDAEVKAMVLNDLEMFVKRRDKYRRIGKAWKRGYLLYGPPGTGKSSLIAAMANYLNFDVYDLELTDITRNSELRQLLIATANRSILVVEDIDCTIELQERVARDKDNSKSKDESDNNEEQSKVTLSGFLNFIDGLWSSIGDERIIIFTTNHKEKLDPALLRPGRMDLHVHMSYCTPCGFKLLAANYLGIKTHHLFGKLEGMISTIEVTPAEVAEQLLKSDDANVSLSGLVDFLDMKKKENEEAKAKSQLEKAQSENDGDGDGESKKDQKESENSKCKHCHCCCCCKQEHVK